MNTIHYLLTVTTVPARVCQQQSLALPSSACEIAVKASNRMRRPWTCLCKGLVNEAWQQSHNVPVSKMARWLGLSVSGNGHRKPLSVCNVCKAL
jgi:hypothetical protein